MDLISVIIPVYNVEQYLSTCIDSVINQTYHNLEIILVDDGSPDRCGVICDEYAMQDSRIRVIHKVNGGLSDARNAGIEIARGQWLAFIDSDDYIAPCTMEELLSSVMKHNADMAICGVVTFRDTNTGRIENDKRLSLDDGITSGIEILKSVRQFSQIPAVYAIACNKLYRKTLFDDLRYPIGLYHEDDAIAHHIIGKCDQIVCVGKPLYFYRQTPGSIMNCSYNINRLDAFVAYADRIRYYESHGLSDYSPPMQDYYFWLLFQKYFLFSESPETKAKLAACRKATRSILPFYLTRKDVLFTVKLSVIIFCYFPNLYRKIFKK